MCGFEGLRVCGCGGGVCVGSRVCGCVSCQQTGCRVYSWTSQVGLCFWSGRGSHGGRAEPTQLAALHMQGRLLGVGVGVFV